MAEVKLKATIEFTVKKDELMKIEDIINYANSLGNVKVSYKNLATLFR